MMNVFMVKQYEARHQMGIDVALVVFKIERQNSWCKYMSKPLTEARNWHILT